MASTSEGARGAPAVHGTCDARFAAVREAFIENFTARGDCGAALCISIDGRPVVDLWGGWADAAHTRPWTPETIVCVASTTKGLASVCAHRLIERGALDPDAPVARYWPQFAQAGKEGVLVRHLLSHRAGVPAIRADLPADTLYDWDAFCAALAREAPWWVPGTRHGYHATTFGFLIGELVRRIDGRSIGRLAAEEICGPLGADFHIGVPEYADARAAEVLPEPAPGPEERSVFTIANADPYGLPGRVFLNPPRAPQAMNTRRWRAAEIPASNGHASARGVARLYSALALGGAVDGIRILGTDAIEAAILEQSFGEDAVLGVPTRYGMGFMLRLPQPGVGILPLVPNPRVFGHTGRGGSIGFADREARVAFGYVMNQFIGESDKTRDRRWGSLARAFYAALG
ncbi:MAG: serine hydrolase domain-containing protein [Gammaproteobacteria bacterium]